MKEILIKIKFDDEGGYKGHGDETPEVITSIIEHEMEVELEGDGVIKSGWSVEVVEKPEYPLAFLTSGNCIRMKHPTEKSADNTPRYVVNHCTTYWMKDCMKDCLPIYDEEILKRFL